MAELSVETSNASTISGEKTISKIVNIRCDDYGFECDYFMEGIIDQVVDAYWKHMNDEHGIEYSKGTIYKSIYKKYPTLVWMRFIINKKI